MHVSVGKVRRGARGVDYYNKLEREDYYLNAGSPAGQWWGRLAADFGLFGEVGKEDFCTLHSGYSPEGEPLSKNVKHELRRPAFDLTHSLVKDASIIASVNEEWRRRIFEEVATPAVQAGLTHLENEACWSRRGFNGVELVRGRGFAVSIFDHMVSRAVDDELDPQVHKHCVIFNTTRGPDGQLRTLDGDFLYHHAQSAAALASVEEAYQLERLGFHLERSGRSFVIVGISQELRDLDSKRSKQIREHAGDEASARERDRANWETREPKEKVDVPAVLKDWQERNERHGLTLAQVQEMSRHKLLEREVAKELDEATSLAKKDICYQESTFTARNFLELTALECQCRGVRANDVRLHVSAELERSRRGLSNDIVFLGQDRNGEERWTTRELHELERKILHLAELTKNQRSFVSKGETEAAIRKRPTLEPDQAEAVCHITVSPGQIKCVLGGAGTGKTFMLDCARETIEAGGGRVIGTSLSTRATRELASQGHIRESYNIRKLIFELDRGRLRLDSKTSIFMDEAAMTGTRDFARISLEVAKTGAQLIAVGDYRQHQSIEAGGTFLGLSKRHAPKELQTIIRQRDDDDKRMVAAFRDGRIAEALGSLVRRDRLHIGQGVSEAQELAVKRWAEDPVPVSQKILIASTNKQCEWLNDRCQEQLAGRGELSGEGIVIKDGARTFVGERIIFRQNAPGWGLPTGISPR